MTNRKDLGALDTFRIIAALLVICIHTSPLWEIDQNADLFLTGVSARLAVPFFFMVSGYFGDLSSGAGVRKIAFKTMIVYAAAIIIYLPYGSYFANIKMILFDGAFYHLWYFPALITGVVIVYFLKKLPLPFAFAAAVILYAVGLFGDAYYNLAVKLEPLQKLYDTLSKVFSYTRNGIFTAPVFLLIGSTLSEKQRKKPLEKTSVKSVILASLGLAVSLGLLTAERFKLRGITFAPHDNMFVFLIPSALFLLLLLTSIKAKPHPFFRSAAMWIYIIHPIFIDLAGKLGIESSLKKALCAAALSAIAACAVTALFPKLKSFFRKASSQKSRERCAIGSTEP